MKRTLIVLLSSLILGFAGLWLVARQDLLDPSLLATAVWNPWLLLLGTVSIVALWGAPGWRLSLLSHGPDTRLPFHLALPVHVVTILGAAITPGNSGGAPVMAVTLNRLGLPLGQGISLAVQTVILDLFFLAWSVPASLLYLLATGGLQLPGGTAGLLFLVAGLFSLLAFVLTYRPRSLIRVLLRTAELRILRRFRRRLRRAARDYLRSAERFASTPWNEWLALHVLTALGWLGGFALYWALLAMFGNRAGPLTVFAVLDLVVLVGNVVPTPGGSGFVEAVVGQITKVQAGVVSVAGPLLVWRLVTFYSVFLLGPLATGYLVLFGKRGDTKAKETR